MTPPLAIFLLLLAGGAGQPLPQTFGKISVHDGPMGPAPMPWESDAAFLRVQSGVVGNWEDWYDVGTLALAGAVDQTWGRYALAARSIVTALRLRPGLPAAHYHLGYAIQRLRDNAGGDWRWKAWNSFELATRGLSETSFEGLAWFHIENGNAQAAFRAYERGLRVLCVGRGHDRECNLSTEFVHRWSGAPSIRWQLPACAPQSTLARENPHNRTHARTRIVTMTSCDGVLSGGTRSNRDARSPLGRKRCMCYTISCILPSRLPGRAQQG